MFFKKIKKLTIFLFLTLFSMPSFVLAYSEYIIAGGQNIGIEIKSKGVLVVGTYMVNNSYPAVEAGLKIGDMIVSIDEEKVSSVGGMITRINAATNGSIKVGYIRNNITEYTNLKLYMEDNSYKTGIYVKDSITGIGTLTYIDPKTKLFGALGHEIIEKNSRKILETNEGTIFDSEVIGIDRSSSGEPGEKSAKYFVDKIKGSIFENTTQGIFGNYSGDFNEDKLYKVASYSDIKKGDAIIRTVLDGTEIKEYKIKITKVSINQKTKNINFEIIDKELLSKTGGIVQGMSGSPIIQGDFIVGAVTHVVIEDPTRGYGIFIRNMLEESEN